MSGLAGLTRCELAQREVLPTVSEGWPASPILHSVRMSSSPRSASLDWRRVLHCRRTLAHHQRCDEEELGLPGSLTM